MTKSVELRAQFIQAFMASWDEVYQGDRRAILDKRYDTKEPWTALMCGHKPADLGGCSLLERTIERLKYNGMQLQFDPERQDMDAYGRVILEIPHEQHTDGINVIMVEVENSAERSYQEFWKFVHSRCVLRVLITYQPAKGGGLVTAKARMSRIYQGACKVLGPDNASAYLLIVGTRVEGSIKWVYEGMKADGEFFGLPELGVK